MHTGKQKQMNVSYQASLVNRHTRRFTGNKGLYILIQLRSTGLVGLNYGDCSKQGRRHGFSPVGARFPIYIVHCVPCVHYGGAAHGSKALLILTPTGDCSSALLYVPSNAVTPDLRRLQQDTAV